MYVGPLACTHMYKQVNTEGGASMCIYLARCMGSCSLVEVYGCGRVFNSMSVLVWFTKASF